jgi:5'-nucleotidase
MILLTNDDGIEAPGLLALAQAVLPSPCIVVAPMHPMSECSHCVTTKKPLLIERRDTDTLRRFAIDGTPADCVRVALLHLLPEIGVDIEAVRVFSGINAGGNLGADIYISGTVAAVREAAFFGLPGIAFSQYRRGEPTDAHWQRAARLARRTIAHLELHPLSPGEFWNVNFPWPGPLPQAPNSPQPGEAGFDDLDPPVTLCDRSRRPLPVKYESIEGALHYVAGRYHGRQYEKGSDIDHCFTGHISASRITI